MSADQPKEPAASASPEAPYPPIGYAWFVVGVLMLIYVFSFVDRQILSLLAPAIKKDLAISDAKLGWLMGPAFAFFYTFLGIPLGRMADRFSRRAIIAVGLVLWSLMTACCGLADGFITLFAFRLGVGVGEATLSPCAYSMVTDYFPRKQLATALSVYSMGIYIGSGLALIFGGLVLKYVGSAESIQLPLLGAVKPWQAIFLIVGLPGIPFTLLLLAVKEPVRRGIGGGGKAAQASLGEVAGYIASNGRTFACHNLGFGLMAMAGYAGANWIPMLFYRIHKWTPADVGWWYGWAVLLFGSAGIVSAGKWADHLSAGGRGDAKMRVAIYSVLGWLPFGVAFPLVDDGVLAMWIVAPSAFFLAMPFGVAAAAIQEIMPANMRGLASAVYLFVINLVGMGAGPLLLGVLNDKIFTGETGVRYSLMTLTLVAQVGAMALLYLGLAPFRQSVERLKQWNAGAA